MRSQIAIGQKNLELPAFFPTINLNPSSHFWKYNVKCPCALISFDVISKDKELLNEANAQGIAKALDFEGIVLLDNGGFGDVEFTEPVITFEKQKELDADIYIALDMVSNADGSNNNQWSSVLTTLGNIDRIISTTDRRGILLEGVIQGVNERQYVYCAEKMKQYNPDIYGIGVSAYTSKRNYLECIEKIVRIKKIVGEDAVIHALGCGSRTFIAVLGALGVSIFDSMSYFYESIYHDFLEPVTLCSTGSPDGKCAQCAECLAQVDTTKIDNYFKYNLNEILKEIQRTRCALRKGTMEYYLKKRLSEELFNNIGRYF